MDTSSIFGFIVALYASLTTCAVPPSDLPAQQQEQTAIVAEQETQEPAEPEVQPIYDPVATPKQPTVNAANVGYNDKKSWWFRRNADHLPPSAQDEIAIGNYDAYYLGDTQHKVIYLTFDEGYENGYTSKILDILKANFLLQKAIWKTSLNW